MRIPDWFRRRRVEMATCDLCHAPLMPLGVINPRQARAGYQLTSPLSGVRCPDCEVMLAFMGVRSPEELWAGLDDADRAPEPAVVPM